MLIRVVGVLLLAGVVCLGTVVADESAASLLSKGRDEYKRGNFTDAERYLRLAVETTEHGGDVAQFAEALVDLSRVLSAKGQYEESKRLWLRALSILRTAQSKQYLAVVLNNLSVLSTREGDDVQTARYLKESLRVAKELDPRDPYISHILNNLGALYYRTGNKGGAEKAFKQAIALIEKESGSDRVDLVRILTNLGGIYVTRKKWDEAAALFNRALSMVESSNVLSQTLRADVLDGVGSMHYARASFSEAEKAFRKSYTIRGEVFGPKHPAVAGAALNLAAFMTRIGRYTEAEGLYADALQNYENALGPHAPEVASTLDEMAELFRKTNRHEAASESASRAESIRFGLERVIGVDQLQ